MKKLIRHGTYSLILTPSNVKIITLDNEDSYAWIVAKGIGGILSFAHKPKRTDTLLATGKYMLYKVKDEPNLVDLDHLQLEVGRNMWQGYLLTNGLPGAHEKHRIIPTTELIRDKNHAFETYESYMENTDRLIPVSR